MNVISQGTESYRGICIYWQKCSQHFSWTVMTRSCSQHTLPIQITTSHHITQLITNKIEWKYLFLLDIDQSHSSSLLTPVQSVLSPLQPPVFYELFSTPPLCCWLWWLYCFHLQILAILCPTDLSDNSLVSPPAKTPSGFSQQTIIL